MEEIYKKYSKKIYKYLYTLTKNHELSEELMQDTFCSAIKSIDTFRKESSIFSWLCEIAKNKWKNYIIKNNKIQLIEFNDELKHWLIDDDIEDEILKKNESIKLHSEIEKLDEKSKEVIYLRINGELQFKEIGKILNKSETWARTTFYRSKLKLKEGLKDEARM